MARSFSTLFFKAAKKLGRIQRAALNLAVPGASGKRAAASRRAAARRSANASRDGASPSLGLGRWEASRQFTDGLGRRLALPATFRPACRARACRWWSCCTAAARPRCRSRRVRA